MRLEKIAEICLFLSIVLAPFDGINIIKFFIYNYAFCWTTTVGIVIYFFIVMKSQKVYFGKLIKIWCIFFIWNIISTIVNLNNILGVSFKGYSAERMVLISIINLIFLLLVMLYYNYILIKKDNVIIWIYKAIKISFFIVIIFSVIQLLGMFEIQTAVDINLSIQKIINIQSAKWEDNEFTSVERIIGVSQEASLFGNYVTSIFPWLLLGVIYFDKNLKSIILCCLLVIFTILSYSRIAYGCILLELLITIFLLKKFITLKQWSGIIFVMVIIGIGLINFFDTEFIMEKVTGVFMSFSSEAEIGRLYSNITRIGLQVAGLNMFMSDPIFGLGLSQFRFNYIYFLPTWAYLSPEIILATDTGSVEFFYSSFNTYVRILAESGIVGLFLWGLFFIIGLKNYLYILKFVPSDKKIIIKLIMMSYIMSIIGFMNFDEYIFFYYWLLLILSNALIIKINNKKNIF